MITVYGIRQCDTCRKALKWLDAQPPSQAPRTTEKEMNTAAKLDT